MKKTALFIAMLVIAFMFASPINPITMFSMDVALAQQQSATADKPILAQNAPKEAAQTTDRHPTFDSTNPSRTMLDWGMSAFCVADNLGYDWQRNQCIPFQPET